MNAVPSRLSRCRWLGLPLLVCLVSLPGRAQPAAADAVPSAVQASPSAPAPGASPAVAPAPEPQPPSVAGPLLEAEDERPTESVGWMLLRTLVVLGVVVASIYLTLNFGLRKLMGLQGPSGRSRRLVAVLERHPVGPKQSLLVLEAAGEYLLVGAGEGGMSLLCKLERSEVERLQQEGAAPLTPLTPSPFLQKLLARKAAPGSSTPPAA